MIVLQYNEKLASDHFDLVKGLVIQSIDRVLLDGGIYKGKGSSRTLIAPSPSLERFLGLLSNNQGLETLITGKPDRLEKYISNVIRSNPNFTDSKESDYMILYNIFATHSYKNDLFCKKQFIDNIGLDTCPYCNRNYTFTLSKTRKIKPQIDHFYPTSRYPFLAISYYNLIPSCETCNGFGGKCKTDPFIVGLVSPYKISNSDFTFSYRHLVLQPVNSLSKNQVKVCFSKKIQTNSDLFKLEDLYEKHNDHVVELILKRKLKYSKRYVKFLMKLKGLRLSEDEVDRMILGNYSKEDQIHKRPLAKLYQDIGMELGIFTR